MALSWRESTPQSYSGARKWGTGINPVHARRSGNEARNNVGPANYEPANTGLVNIAFAYVEEDYAYHEDYANMASHPNLGDRRERARSAMPPWGTGTYLGPNGTAVRLHKRGYSWREEHANLQPEDATAGWRNKESGQILDSTISAEAQLYVQTSLKQRDATRTNQHATARGTDDTRHSIASRIVGMRVKEFSGGYRHYDMQPKEQSYLPRPFRYRDVGTGNPEWMRANAFRSVIPRFREIPADVDTGAPEYEDQTGVTVPDDWYY